ncbi:MAG TPA: hypothetical protein VNI20_12145, partial [Fimbriimonadaceae bacterium]|nr:hypothetical protein [Fimbriimonadaceae bacterium]
MSSDTVVVLKRGKDKKVRNFYPWIQRGEVAEVNGDPEDGSLVRLVSSEGEFLAIASWNTQSRFQARVISLEDEPIDQALFERRFAAAICSRKNLVAGTNARRIVFSEADLAPGLIADDYDGHIVLQVRSLTMENLKDVWLPALIKVAKPKSVYERSEMQGRQEEGLPSFAGQLYGETPEETTIEESGIRFIVPLKS